jgi:hypothetical protein
MTVLDLANFEIELFEDIVCLVLKGIGYLTLLILGAFSDLLQKSRLQSLQFYVNLIYLVVESIFDLAYTRMILLEGRIELLNTFRVILHPSIN